MSADNLTTQYVSDTYRRLLQISDNGIYLTDGTGSIVSLLSTTSSYALTASYVSGITAVTPGGGLWSIQFNSASTFQGSSNLTFNSTTSNLSLTGSILMSGSSTEAHISTLNWIDFNPNLAVDPPFTTGRLHWVDDTKTLGLDTDVNGSVIELGHQHVVRVVNQTGVTISKGSIVYISGSQGTRPGIATASYTDENDSATTLGFVMHDIVGSSGNTNGYVVTRGVIRDVNTFGLLAGSSLYLSSSGQYSTLKPQAPLHDVRLGKVIVGGSTNAGVIYVDIQNGYEIEELHNVRIIGDTTGDLIIKSGSLWINSKQLTGSYGLTGSLTATSFTGSLFGTASWATNALTASLAPNYLLTSATSSMLASYVLNSRTGSFATTGSNSFNGNQVITGSITFAPPSVDRSNGEIVYFGTGTLTLGKLYVLQSGGNWSLVNAGSGPSKVIGMLGIALGTSPSDGILVRGLARNASFTATAGDILYAGTTDGDISSTQPTVSNHIVRVVGYQTPLTNTIYFSPDPTWVTLA